MTYEGPKEIDHKVQNYQNGTYESNSPKIAQSPQISQNWPLYGDVFPLSASSLGVSEGFLLTTRSFLVYHIGRIQTVMTSNSN